MESVAGLLLAAGGGRRVGAPKALLRHGGRLLVEHAIGVLRDAGCAPIVVVLGAGAELVQAEADLGGVSVVVNPAWSTGLGGSLRAGLEALSATEVDAAAVLLVDTPGVTAGAVRRVAALPYPEALVCATYAGRRGHPMLLGRAHWAGIASLAKADVGARPYLLAHAAEVVAVGCDGISSDDDIDTPESAAAWGITVPEGTEAVAGPDPEEHASAGQGPDAAGVVPFRPRIVRQPGPRAEAIPDVMNRRLSEARLRAVPDPPEGPGGPAGVGGLDGSEYPAIRG